MYMFKHPMEIHDHIQQKRREKEIRDIKNSINSNNHPDPVVPHTAKIQRASILLKSKYSDGNKMFDDYEVAERLGLTLYEVESLKARLEKEAKETKRFLTTGQMPREGGYVAILPK